MDPIPPVSRSDDRVPPVDLMRLTPLEREREKQRRERERKRRQRAGEPSDARSGSSGGSIDVRA